MKFSKGFTLLELVVVVAIIGLLASIALIPNLIRFQQRAAASKMKAVSAQLASAYELAGSEGCTDFDIALGGVVDCDAPTAQVYIQTFATNPTAGPALDFDGTCDVTLGAPGSNLNPSTTALNFCVTRFLVGSGNFVCNQGSCACTVAGACER